MRLHYHPLSPYSRKAWVAVLHREQDIDCVVVDVMKGGLSDPAFQAISPFGKMPVLETKEGPLIESTSIIEYLEEKGPRSLLPRGAERIARHWDRLGDLYLIEPMSVMWFAKATSELDEPRETIKKAWPLFEARLEGRPFLVGELFTLADLAGAIATDSLVRLGEEPPPRVRAWAERCHTEIPAMEKALAAAAPFMKGSLERRAARLAG